MAYAITPPTTKADADANRERQCSNLDLLKMQICLLILSYYH